MASQRHKRENFFPNEDKYAVLGNSVASPPLPAMDSANEAAFLYDEVASWPNDARPEITDGVPAEAVFVRDPAGLPVTGDAGGTVSVLTIIDTGGLTLLAAATATVTYDIGAGEATVQASLTLGMTNAEINTAVAAAIDGVVGLGGAAAPLGVETTPGDTVELSQLELVIVTD